MSNARVAANNTKAPYKLKARLHFESREHFENAKKIVLITGLSMDEFIRHSVERELNRTADLIRAQIMEQQTVAQASDQNKLQTPEEQQAQNLDQAPAEVIPSTESTHD